MSVTRKKPGKVLIDAEKLIVVDEDHGGYLAGHCGWCDASGWIDKLPHKRGCPVPKALVVCTACAFAFFYLAWVTK